LNRGYAITSSNVKTGGTGNAVTGVSVSNGVATLNKGYVVSSVTTTGTGSVITGASVSNGTLTLQKGAISGVVDGDGVQHIKALTKAEYDALGTYDSQTLYIVTGN
jgi:hypothetical protein